jgi:hypothetical protein
VPDQITAILSRHTGQKDELIPILQEVQEELGYLPAAVQRRGKTFLREKQKFPSHSIPVKAPKPTKPSEGLPISNNIWKRLF